MEKDTGKDRKNIPEAGKSAILGKTKIRGGIIACLFDPAPDGAGEKVCTCVCSNRDSDVRRDRRILAVLSPDRNPGVCRAA